MLAYVVAKAHNNVIGSKNDLPWYLPADLKHFKELTLGHTVVMGRKTFESIIARLGKPLPGRQTIVITRNKDFFYPGVGVLHDVTQIADFTEDVYVAGGAEIYDLLFDKVERLYVTEVKADIPGDTYFPVIDMEVWREIARESHARDEKNQFDYDFVTYDRIA